VDVLIKQFLNVNLEGKELLKTLEKEYTALASNFGYFPVQSELFLCFKKADSQIGVEVQFGGEKAILESLEKLVRSKSDICILLTSSKTPSPSLSWIRAMLLKKFSIGNQKYIFFDIHTKRLLKVEQEIDKFFSELNRPEWARPLPPPRPPIFKKRKKFV
jgi:disulfide oxidoreductase YuzD